ncbi:MAG: hypothetical protein HY042_12005, partial [Spirochaetia bacterium]|nr:hypothetical protein [Spirochaetia bacterium]
GFWLGLSAAAGYGYALFLAYHVNDTPVADAFRRSPVAASAVLLGLAFLIGYTVYSAVRQHHTTVDICDGLKALRIFRAYKDSIETVQSLQWMQEGIGAFLNLGLSGLISVSNDVVDRITEEKIKNALGRFAAESAVEFAGRILLIGLTLFLLRGHFTLLP